MRNLTTASLELERLSRILDEWLDAARLEEGTLALSRSPIDCAELLGEAVALFRALSARHRFELSLPPQPLRLEGDGPRLRQVVHNLLGLALHELPAGGPVRVAASRRGLHAVISLHVNVAVELAEPRFAALRKLDDALLGVPGAGLTPAVCKKLIEAHGGQLQIARTGRGALVIEMTLPALPPESLALEPASSRLHLS